MGKQKRCGNIYQRVNHSGYFRPQFRRKRHARQTANQRLDALCNHLLFLGARIGNVVTRFLRDAHQLYDRWYQP